MKSHTSTHCGPIFLMGDMRRNVFPKNLDGHQHGGRKPAETFVTEFCCKSVNLSLEEPKNVLIILYSNTRTVQIDEFPKISLFLNQYHSSLVRRHAKA